MPIVVRTTPLPPVTPEIPLPETWPSYNPGARPRITIFKGDQSIEFKRENGASLRPGLMGLDMPPYELVTDNPGGQDGARLDFVRVLERPIFIPFMLESTTNEGLRALKRKVAQIVTPTTGDTRILVEHQDGTRRQIWATGSQALGQAWAWDARTWQKVGIDFIAYDPFWQSVDPSTKLFAPAAPVEFLGEEFFPMSLSSDRTLGDVTVDNNGDADTYPTWEIHGPGEDLTITNSTTGYAFGIEGTIASDEIVFIDTNPNAMTIVDDEGTDAWMRTSEDSHLWPLVPGLNAISISMASSEPGTSYVRVNWTTRHLTAM